MLEQVNRRNLPALGIPCESKTAAVSHWGGKGMLRDTQHWGKGTCAMLKSQGRIFEGNHLRPQPSCWGGSSIEPRGDLEAWGTLIITNSTTKPKLNSLWTRLSQTTTFMAWEKKMYFFQKISIIYFSLPLLIHSKNQEQKQQENMTHHQEIK